MEKATLSGKGRIVIPKALRDAQRWGPGTLFTVQSVDGQLVLTPMLAVHASRVNDVAGCLKAPPSRNRSRRPVDDHRALSGRALREDEASKA